MERKNVLEDAINKIDIICDKIINKDNFMMDMQMCVQAINSACMLILEENEKDSEVIPLLEDIMYGMTQQDEVFLSDVLRFGMKVKLKSLL